MSALHITTCRTADVDAALQDAIVRMCTAAHGNDFGSLFSFLPPEGLHVIGWMNAEADAEVAGHAVITTRWLQPQGLPLLRTAYVDAVATLPACQPQGIGSAVMRRLAEEAASEGYEIAGLESGLRGFYERLGWEQWRGPLAGRTETGLAPTPEQDGIFILRLPKTPPLDLHGLLTIEAGGRIW
jgi:aminoglycoside 2'-N-acetyltransferase I